MNASAAVAVEIDAGGRLRLARLRAQAPLVLRPTGPGQVHLVGGAAGPLPGDRLCLDVEVGPGARLTVRSVAATVALAGPGDRGSELVVRARVGPGGELRWLPEPAVAAAGCRHRVAARVVLAAGAGLMWREELVGGRHGEPAGSLASRLDLELAGRPLYRSELGLGPGHPGWDGPAGTAGARAAGSVVVVRPAWAEGGPPPAAVVAGGLGAVLPLAGPGAVVAAVGPGAASLRAALAEGLAALV